MIELFYQFSYSSLSMDRKRPKNNTSSVPELTIYASIGGGLEHFALCIGHNILNISCIPSLFRIKRFDITCRISWWSIDKYLPATDSLNSGGSRHIAITVAWMCVICSIFFTTTRAWAGFHQIIALISICILYIWIQTMAMETTSSDEPDDILMSPTNLILVSPMNLILILMSPTLFRHSLLSESRSYIIA